MRGAALIVAVAGCSLLSGCESLWYAGVSDYQLTMPDGAQIAVRSGKQQQSVNASFEQTATGYVITLKEAGVQAFKGQAVAASAASDAVGAAAGAAVTALKTLL